ncbi:hypothetical protein SAMN05421788_110230 [Filimonas lacunae]|uniref:Lipoprotein n=1 Tax=Filimonas lacunae TaxID=477680 RepID=A0A173MAK6_9BACT|nr:hypothetical protein [Filimonas lacunae]BAV04498.1 hypothetical protein FLA_0490 [Filimonas lacunae]SIT31588.1 hypothetical protein SAMN05421788_110230 [Filimonas lacunae]
MKYLFTLFAFSGLLVTACNTGNESQTDTEASKDSGIVAGASHAVEHVEVQPQEKPEAGQYCYIDKVYTVGDSSFIDADYIQFLMGEEAVAAARKKGDAEPIVKNGDTTWAVMDDYYIVNDNKQVRKLKLSKDFKYISVSASPQEEVNHKTPLEQLKEKAKKDYVFILTFNADNEVSAIKNQFLP